MSLLIFNYNCPKCSEDVQFSKIWTDLSNPLMSQLKYKVPHLKGRCAACQWKHICGGNFRVRAEAVSNDLWAPDPACYLTDEEIGLSETLLENVSTNSAEGELSCFN